VSFEGRLKRLEESGRGGICPECGYAPDEPRELAVISEDKPERSFKGDPYEACASCGQPLYTVIRVVRDSSPVDEGGGGRR
jgi:hypothetical protein